MKSNNTTGRNTNNALPRPATVPAAAVVPVGSTARVPIPSQSKNIPTKKQPVPARTTPVNQSKPVSNQRPLFCPDCGEKVIGGAFCANCGAKLPIITAAAAAGTKVASTVANAVNTAVQQPNPAPKPQTAPQSVSIAQTASQSASTVKQPAQVPSQRDAKTTATTVPNTGTQTSMNNAPKKSSSSTPMKVSSANGVHSITINESIVSVATSANSVYGGNIDLDLSDDKKASDLTATEKPSNPIGQGSSTSKENTNSSDKSITTNMVDSVVQNSGSLLPDNESFDTPIIMTSDDFSERFSESIVISVDEPIESKVDNEHIVISDMTVFSEDPIIVGLAEDDDIVSRTMNDTPIVTKEASQSEHTSAVEKAVASNIDEVGQVSDTSTPKSEEATDKDAVVSIKKDESKDDSTQKKPEDIAGKV